MVPMCTIGLGETIDTGEEGAEKEGSRQTCTCMQ